MRASQRFLRLGYIGPNASIALPSNIESLAIVTNRVAPIRYQMREFRLHRVSSIEPCWIFLSNPLPLTPFRRGGVGFASFRWCESKGIGLRCQILAKSLYFNRLAGLYARIETLLPKWCYQLKYYYPKKWNKVKLISVIVIFQWVSTMKLEWF